MSSKNAQWENWINVVLGIWLFISPWVLASNFSRVSSSTNWNVWIVGIILVASSSAALQQLKAWEEWLSLILGLWLIASPWALGFSDQAALLWNAIIVGLAIVITSGFALPEALQKEQSA
ncbi:MAG: SPW repeat protein [Bdellovibrionota bacterium]